MILYQYNIIWGDYMSLPHGLLGLLRYESKTGYELTKTFEASLNHFWHAQSSQIYRELNRMEDKGWVASQNIIQNKRPNKRVYSITEDGNKAFIEWLNTRAPLFENPHEPMLMRVFFGASSPEVTLELLKKCRDICLQSLEEQFNDNQANIDSYSLENSENEKDSVYWQMAKDFGVAYTKATADWAQKCIDKLKGDK